MYTFSWNHLQNQPVWQAVEWEGKGMRFARSLFPPLRHLLRRLVGMDCRDALIQQESLKEPR